MEIIKSNFTRKFFYVGDMMLLVSKRGKVDAEDCYIAIMLCNAEGKSAMYLAFSAPVITMTSLNSVWRQKARYYLFEGEELWYERTVIKVFPVDLPWHVSRVGPTK